MKFIELLISKIEHREKCKDAAVPFRKIMFAKYNDSVKKYMSAMHKNLFTHIPIINDSNCVIGVFDENSIFNFLSNETIIEIDEKILFSDIKEYLSLDDRDMETFIFFKNGAYVDDLLQDFNEKFKNRSRLEAVFLTSTGRKNEPLLGMITAWDLLGRYNN